VLAPALVAIPYFASTLLIARRRHLWNDELYTYSFARLPSLADVWHQLATGVEQTPPFFYVLTRASLSAFGDGAVAIRLPEILGIFAACCLVFAVVARRTSVLFGTIAVLVVLVTNTFSYAFEARPYGLELAFAAAMLLCWQLRADTGSTAAVVGLAAALAAGVSTHYYAAFLVLPIAAAEAVRALERRRLDLPVAAALVLGLAPIAAFWPLVEGARKYSGSFWTTYGWSGAVTFYAWLLRTDVVPPWVGTWTLVAFVVAIVAGSLAVTALVTSPAGETPLRGARPGRPSLRGGDAPERAAAVGFLLLPLVSVAVAETVTGAYTERYVLPAVLGLAVLVPLALGRLARRGRAGRVLGIGVLLALVAVSARAAVYDYHDAAAAVRFQSETIRFLVRSAPTGMPIFVDRQHDFLELSHYAPPALHRRLHYLADSRLALRYLGTSSSEDGLVVMSRFAPLHVDRFADVVGDGRPLLVFDGGSGGGSGWLLQALADRGRRLQVVAQDAGRELVYVPAPGR
jgi:4-amino-4-deoxy-L-arabinose transferase-like glycosyltransferase